MRTIYKLGIACCAVVGFALVVGTDAEARCSRVTAKGEGLTKELAREMAKVNLDFSIATKSAKSAGKVSYRCGQPGMLLFNSCTATQRACT